MKASMIFTSNDVIINLGIIVAGLLVNWLNSSKPDNSVIHYYLMDMKL